MEIHTIRAIRHRRTSMDIRTIQATHRRRIGTSIITRRTTTAARGAQGTGAGCAQADGGGDTAITGDDRVARIKRRLDLVEDPAPSEP